MIKRRRSNWNGLQTDAAWRNFQNNIKPLPWEIGNFKLSGNYEKIIRNNVRILFEGDIQALAERLPALKIDNRLEFRAFGWTCLLRPEGILLDGKEETGALGILISLYALHADLRECRAEPFKAFKDLPNSSPYVNPFAARTQQILIPHVKRIRNAQPVILEAFGGNPGPSSVGGDFSFTLYPFPKIGLCYIFYAADDDFPASVICLFSNNALSFAPIDALADTGEYTSRAILKLISLRDGY